jgi:hypothetical protein
MTLQTATNGSLEPFHVVDIQDTAAPLVKREGLTGTNHGTKRTTIDFGDARHRPPGRGRRHERRTLSRAGARRCPVRLRSRHIQPHRNGALLARVAAETERRCPISNLIRDAGVQLQTRWIREATG